LNGDQVLTDRPLRPSHFCEATYSLEGKSNIVTRGCQCPGPYELSCFELAFIGPFEDLMMGDPPH